MKNNALTRWSAPILWLAGVLLVVPLPATSAPTEKVVEAVEVTGNRRLSSAAVLGRMKTQAGRPFSQSDLSDDVKRLYEWGPLARAEIEARETATGLIRVRVEVVEKPVVDKIIFRGNRRIKDRKLMREVRTITGEILMESRLKGDLRLIADLYEKDGYLQTRVDYEIKEDEATGLAEVIFRIDEGKPVRIKAVTIAGAEQLREKELLGQMRTKPRLWIFGIYHRGRFKPDQFAEDLERIAFLYRHRGYLDARIVGVEKEYSPDGRRMFIRIEVEEGRLYRIGEITFSGNELFSSEQLAENIQLKPSEPFSTEILRTDTRALFDFYQSRGYIDASIRPMEVFNSGTEKMDVDFSIRESELFHVNRIDIAGNTITRDRVIRRELALLPGEVVDGLRIRRSQERLYNLGYFSRVVIEPVSSEVPGRKDLLVELEEKRTGDIMVGFGYSSIDDFIGYGEIGLGNFDISNPPAFQGAGQKIRLRAEIGRKRDSYELSFTEPWLFGIPLSAGFDLYRRQWYWSEYSEGRTGGRLRFRRRLAEFIEAGLVYQLEEVRLYDLSDTAPAVVREEEGRALISSLTPSLIRDTRDSYFLPSRGLRTVLATEIAGGALGGDRDYVKTTFSNAFYHSIFPGHILSFIFRAGTVQSYGDTEKVPFSEKFFLGGPGSIRGFRYREVGPFDPATLTPLGGDSMMIGTVEYTFPIVGSVERGLAVRGAVFYDIGNVWDGKSWGDSSNNGFNSGAGVGIRLYTPIGPLHFDYGWPLKTGPEGWNDTGGRFHFNIGYMF